MSELIYNPPPYTSPIPQNPMPREFNGKKYYGAADVAKIIGVTQKTVWQWQNQGLFTADERAHDGRYLYEVERVMQLKSVYHPKWMRGSYELSPTTAEPVSPYAQPTHDRTDADIVKNLSRKEREALKEKILTADPNYIYTSVSDNRNPDKRKFICPKCGNGTGKDKTPADATFKGDRWLYYCQRCGFGGDLLKIIADDNHLNLSNFDDMCHALAIGANIIGDNFAPIHSPAPYETPQTDSKQIPIIKADIADAQNHLNDISESRGLTLSTLKHFHCGFIQKWIHPICRVKGYDKYIPAPSRRIIIPTPDGQHYNAVALDSERTTMKKQYHKMHAGAKSMLFNYDALLSNHDLILVTEGEFDAMSIWQASSGNIAVVATLGVGGYQQLILPLIDNHKISGKKFLILFDGDDTGRKRALEMQHALRLRNVLSSCKFFFDALSDDDKNKLGEKVDANDLLRKRGAHFLNNLIQKIITDARADFDAEEDFNALVNLWHTKNNNAVIKPETLAELKAAKKFLDELTSDNFKSQYAYDLRIRFYIALLKFYTPSLAPSFFNILRDAITAAKNRIKANPFLNAEENNALANIAPSTIEKEIDVLVTTVKQQQKKFLSDLAQEQALQAERERWNKKQSLPKNTNYVLSDKQIEYLFGLPNTDLDNALRLDYLFGDQIRFLTDSDRWLAFEKKTGLWLRGNSNSNSSILPFAGRLAKSLDQNEPNPDEHPNAQKIIEAWKNNARIGAGINLLKAVERIRITSDDLDNHPELLNCLNGVVNLQDGSLFENVEPTLLITQKTNAAYLPNSHSDIVDKFLRDIMPDDATRAALLRFLGYCLTGFVSEEKSLFIYGKGGNGKGTLTKLLMATLGDYSAGVPVTAVIEANRFKDAGAATPELNVLEKCRLAIVEELPQGGKLDVAKFKSLTGGDKIPVRRLHEEFHNIEPSHKLLLSGNHMPTLSDARDPGLLRRLLNMNFIADFTINPDKHLKEKLLTDASRYFFLSCLIAESKAWYRDGLLESNAMKNATRQYLNSNDFLGEFISEFCTYGTGKSVELKGFITKLREEYRAETATLSDRALRDSIKRLPSITFGRGKPPARRTCIYGIGWADSSSDDNSAGFYETTSDKSVTSPPEEEFDLSQWD